MNRSLHPLRLLVAWLMLAVSLTPRLVGQDRGLLLLVVPDDDTTRTSSATYALLGSTLPGCTATLDGTPLKVYPTGAFSGLLRLQVGENRFLIAARAQDGRTQQKDLLIIRKPPMQSTRTDTMAIEDAMLSPAEDLWVKSGDIVRVQCKGTPGCRVTFLDGLPMVEVPDSATGGLRGIYRGSFVVSDADHFDSSAVRFVLSDSLGHMVTRETSGRLTVLPARVPLVGVTQGERPYLNYGLGDDRLGGAKLSIIGPGIRLAITGKAGRLYRVALAEDHEAWIEERFVMLEPPGTPPAFTLAGSWSVYGDNRQDYVTIALRERVPYVAVAESGPARICVDLYGVVSNSNWITQHLSSREIRNVSYEQIAKNVLRVSIELRHKQVWGYALSYRGESLVIAIRRQPERLRLNRLTIALDAGHGGENDGAIGATGMKEKEINLSTVLHLKSLLEGEGARVVLTRGADSSVLMNGRIATILKSNADLLISIHSNAIGNTTHPDETKGVSTYYRHLCYRPLSEAIYAEVLKTGLAPFGNVGGFNFLLNSPTELPSVLVELAFMSNPSDEMRLLDDGFRKELAERIVAGVEEFLESNEE